MELRKRKKILKLLIGICIVIISAYFRFTQIDSSLTLDEADYSQAARKGLIANHLDTQGTRGLRHWHGPMVAYTIIFPTQLFGESEQSIRLSSRLIGSITPLAIYMLSQYALPFGFLVGAISGFLLAIMPISAQVSGVANMHTMATFLIIICFYLTVLFFKKRKIIFLYLLAIMIGLLFTTLEYAFIITMVTGIVFLLYPNQYLDLRPNKLRISRQFLCAVALMFLTIAIVWWAGIAKLHILKNFIFYLKYSKHGHPIEFGGKLLRHLPQWAYLYWYWKLAPAFLIMAVSSIFFLAYSTIKDRKNSTVIILSTYTFILLATLLFQHIMSARYSVHLIPFFCIAIAHMLVVILQKFQKLTYLIIPTLLLVVTATNLPHIYPSVHGDPGYREVAEYLRDKATRGARILSWYPGITQFYLPEFSKIDSYNSGGATEELMTLLKTGFYDYIIIYQNQVRRWPNDVGYLFIKENYLLEMTFYWDEKPVLWLYKSP